MAILKADYILTMDRENRIIRSGAVYFDKSIQEVTEDVQSLLERYPNEDVIEAGEGSVLMPGLINSHVHLEFSKNRTTLHYGDFLPWLYSVIEHRESLVHECDESEYEAAIASMLKSGITAFGAISSYGFDLNACLKAPQKVVYFNEVIGSNPAAVDALFEDFKSRLQSSEVNRSERFFPAVAIHSPYSVHPVLIKHALKLAAEKGCVVSAHFMESRAEREWMDNSSGDFLKFFKELMKTESAVSDAKSFLSQFEGFKPLFVHGVHTTAKERQMIHDLEGVVVHCPISNRLLGSGRLDLEALKAQNIPYLIATDGLSSNYMINLFREMRAALMVQCDLEINLLARDLLRSVTINAASALNLNCGVLETGRSADMALITLPNEVEDLHQLPLQVLLHTNEVDEVYIDGEKQ